MFKRMDDRFNKMDEFLKRINESESKSDGEKIINEMYESCMFDDYKEVVEGFVYESDFIADMLKFFLEKSDVVKSRFLCYVLNTHYKGATSKLMEDLLVEEKYELCAVLDKVIDTVELPTEK